MSDIAAGTQIDHDTTLDRDLVYAEGPALVVVADGVTVDLGGYTVSGDPQAGASGPGIVLREVTGVTVRNGTVQHFEAGVAIEGGSHNVIENLTVQDNVGSPDSDYGDGIVVNRSRENRIQNNVLLRNGPYSGISLGPEAQANQITGNTVTDHDMRAAGEPAAGRQTMGIRVEGPAANNNRIEANTVTGSGADGISVLATCENFNSDPPCVGTPPNEGNEIVGNTANDNGRSGQGAGIRLFSMADPIPPVGNTIRDNVANDNASYGIAIDAAALGTGGNQAIGNRGRGNGEFDGSDGSLMPPCGKNVWQGNDFETTNQPCVSEGTKGRTLS